MPRLIHGNVRSTHDLRDPRAIADLIWRVRLDSNATGAQIDTIEPLARALRQSGARQITIEVMGNAPNALSPLHQHAAHAAGKGEGL